MGEALLYTVKSEYKDKQLVLDYERAELIDPETGEVVEDHLMEEAPHIRASDYAEWESKRHHEVLVSEKDRRLWGPIFSVGERIGAPLWLRQEVFWFYKKARALKTRPEFKGKGIYVSDEKYILAVYYVVAKKRGLTALAEQIASMPCGENGEPCYVNRKRGDPKFKKYLKIVLRYASFIYSNNYKESVKSYIFYFVEVVKVIDSSIDSMKVAVSALNLLKNCSINGGYRPRNLAVALIIKAIKDVHGDVAARRILKELRKRYGISELSVRSILKKLSGEG